MSDIVPVKEDKPSIKDVKSDDEKSKQTVKKLKKIIDELRDKYPGSPKPILGKRTNKRVLKQSEQPEPSSKDAAQPQKKGRTPRYWQKRTKSS